MRRIGAYGGTFDPIHNAHIEVARAVVSAFNLDELLLIPAHVPPHKQADAITGSHHRYAMAVLATIGERSIRVSALELEAPERPYTFETVGRLRDLYGKDAGLFFVMGADSFEDLATWRKPEAVLANANLVAVARPGHSLEPARLPDSFRDRVRKLDRDAGLTEGEIPSGGVIYVLDWVNVDVSSTEIRRRVGEGLPVSNLVPAPVDQYIQRYELYRR